MRYHLSPELEGDDDQPVMYRQRPAAPTAYISRYARPIGLDSFVSRLPKANLGGGCIRFGRLADLDLDVIDEVVQASIASDGQTTT